MKLTFRAVLRFSLSDCRETLILQYVHNYLTQQKVSQVSDSLEYGLRYSKLCNNIHYLLCGKEALRAHCRFPALFGNEDDSWQPLNLQRDRCKLDSRHSIASQKMKPMSHLELG